MRFRLFSVLFSILLALSCSSATEDTSSDPPADPQQESEEEIDGENEPAPEPESEPELGWPDVATEDGSVWGGKSLIDFNDDADVVEVFLEAAPATLTLGDELDVDMYAYNGTVPGPLLEAKVGDEVVVHFRNSLPEPTTVHWHGLRISDEMDGNPRIQNPVEPGEEFEYRFVVEDAGTYWFHPHMKSNEQIEKGLYGKLIVREANAPEFARERFVAVDDILLDGNEMPPFLSYHMEFMHGRTGNALLTNGTVEELTDSAEEGDVERWRLVNTANARTMNLSIEGASFRVVGTDGGRVEPYEVERLEMPVGRRFDVEVLYDQTGEVTLNSNVLSRNDNGEIIEVSIPLLKVDVTETGTAGEFVRWAPAPTIEDRPVDREVEITFDARQDPYGNISWVLNDVQFGNKTLFEFQVGSVVRISLRNLAGPEHPFHLHGQFFEIVNGEPGLKDTVLVGGRSTVEIIAYFDNPGRWMAHCHINEHAELGMMAEIIVNE